jgi:NTE family protein
MLSLTACIHPWLFGLIFLAASAPLSAQRPAQEQTQSPPQPQPTPHLRVGLALSGGAALGLTEIGVLKWFDEHHIPVDRIAGTSMGSIIGAMYASGMSAAEIEDFAEHVEWEHVFLPEPTYTDLAYRRKQDRRDYQISAALGLKHGLRGPNGFNPGNGVGLLLDRLAFSDSNLASFDDLPIPFRCVATNMLTGDRVVLHDGSLALAVHASMAIPGVFTPVELNGQVLGDGGMVENIPVQTLREMQGETIKVIAVDLHVPVGTREQLESLTGVLASALSVMILQNERRSLAQADTTIAVEAGNLSISQYDRIKERIDLGYRSADHAAADLLPYAIRDNSEWQQYLAARAARKRTPPKQVQVVEVEGADSDTDQRIAHSLRSVTQGPLDFPKLEGQLTRIAGEGEFDRLGYEGFTQNGVPALHVTAHEKSYGPPFLDLAVNVDGSGVGAFGFSAGARVTFMDVDHHGAEWRSDLLLGSSNLAATEFYQPLGGTRLFVAPYAFASKLARNAFSGQTRIAVFGDERAGGGLDLGFNVNRRSEIRIGYDIFEGKLDPLIGSAGLPILSGSTGQVRLRYVWDGQDSPAVPSRGTRIIANVSRTLQSPGLFRPIDQIDLQTSTFIPIGRRDPADPGAPPKTSLFINASGGTTFHAASGCAGPTGSLGCPLQLFTLGGPFRLGAYLPDEFIGNHYALAALGLRREFYTLPQLVGGKIYWGAWYDAGTAFFQSGPVAVRGSLNGGVIVETIVGPVAVFGSVSPTGQSRVNFSIGRLF